MTARAHDEAGFTVIELLIASTLLIAVLGATLSVFSVFEQTNKRSQELSESLDRARSGVDRMAKELRNLASPTYDKPEAVERASAFDLVFKTNDPFNPAATGGTNSVRRVRYCLDATTPTQAKLWAMTAEIAIALPATTACPGTGWTGQRVVADSLTNVAGGQNRSVFTYNVDQPATSLADITRIAVHLWIDVNTNRAPREQTLSSGVFLRNQNRAPVVPDFSAVATQNKAVQVNGSAAEDPEGDPLTFVWKDEGTKMNCGGIAADCATFIPASVPPGTKVTRNITLVVTDGSGLIGELTKPVEVIS